MDGAVGMSVGGMGVVMPMGGVLFMGVVRALVEHGHGRGWGMAGLGLCEGPLSGSQA